MSANSRVYFNQTNISPGTSQFVTRDEVLQGLSTLAGDLSGVNFSTFFNQPNPTFSTITMNPTGNIRLPQNITTQTVALSTVGGIIPTQSQGTGGQFNGLGITAGLSGTAYGDLYTKNVIANNGLTTANNDKLLYGYNGIAGLPAAGGTQGFMGWNPTNALPFQLSNVSTINGIPPNTSGTTFTNLSGVNLTTSGMLTSPQIVSVSSINGLPYQAAAASNYITSNVVNLPTNTPTTVISAAVPAGVLAPNTSYTVNFPFVLGANIPSAPLNFQVVFGIRLGGNGQINYTTPYWIAANSVLPISLDINAVVQTNITAITSNLVEVIGIHNAGSTWSDAFYSPPNGANLNTWSIQLFN